MIVPMKKVSIFVLNKHTEAALDQVRQLGVLHVEHNQPPQGQDINLLGEDLSALDACLAVFKQAGLVAQEKKAVTEVMADWRYKARHVVDLWKRYDQLEVFSHTLLNGIRELEEWGDFDPQEIQGLGEKGVYLKLYLIPLRQLEDVPDGVVVKRIFVKGGIVGCAVISNKEFDLTFKEVGLPKQGLSSMRSRLAEDKRAMRSIIDQIKHAGENISAFLDIRSQLEKELEFHRTLAGMGRADPISYVTGYVPLDQAERLRQEAKNRKWGIIITEPAEEDNVPVLLRNPKWVSMINPVFKLMEVVPGYRELDVSIFFLLFLSLFFGMIIGDAGYGAVYFILTFFAQRKFGAKVKEKSAFSLFYLFSSCAIIWGALTGTFFGQQWYLAKGFRPLAPVLNEAKFLMSFCFFLGALQLSLAHGMQAVIKLPSLRAFADAGFICLLWAGFFLAKMFIVGDTFPFFAKWLIWAGVLLIIFFSNPQKNVFKAALEGLGVLSLGIMGNFGDVVSYIRLFAVGLAGVAVADSVNMLAAGAGSNLAARVIILFIGHTINITLGPISVLVHGIRLNVLEFSLLHGNITWSGVAYRPLK